MTFEEEKCEWIQKAEKSIGILSRDVRDDLNYGGCPKKNSYLICGILSTINYLCHCPNLEAAYILMGYYSKKADIK